MPDFTDHPGPQFKFEYQPAQRRSLSWVTRNGGRYLELQAPQHLEVGGQRSGKTCGKLIYGIQHYCLRYAKCDMLALRRTTPELDSGMIKDLHELVPNELFEFNKASRVATFRNGSRIVFGSCPNDVERDIEKYLGTAYPFILVDECAQFSRDVWERLSIRNLISVGCTPDENGNLPVPAIVGCTNPIGKGWDYYHTVFVKREPFEKEDGMQKMRDGSYWAPRGGEMVCIYDPKKYSFNHTTVLDNKAYLKRDPGMIGRLKLLPIAKRRKWLEGYMGDVEGQFFECWSPEHHILDLREDPEAVVWQPWQPVIGGQDWGMGHHNAFYLFTKAMVKVGGGTDYRLKTVCFREIAPEQTGLSSIEFADLINANCYYPKLPDSLIQKRPELAEVSGSRCKISAIFFSHEKFNRVMEAHSPADEYSKLLRERNLPPVSRATQDRIGSAGYMYNELMLGRLVILATCPAIIRAIPSLMRDKKHLDDVEKTDSAADDRYDAFRLGLYGMYREKGTPQEIRDREEADKITDPFAKHFFAMKKRYEAQSLKEEFNQKNVSYWQAKLERDAQ